MQRTLLNGYYLDLFFLEKDARLIEQSKLLQALQAALSKAGLKIDTIVTKKEFSEATKSVPVNRYVRVPNWFLAKYDERVLAPNTLEVVKFDPTKEAPSSGIRLESDVHFENSFFHNSRYMSAYLVQYGKYCILKINYNYKLLKLYPGITDVTGYTGIILTSMFNCSGVYTRAASFSRSQETCCYVYNGDIKNTETGNDTCFGLVNTAKTIDLYGIDCRHAMDFVDQQISIYYAADDIIELEDLKKKHFSKYGVDKIDIYKKIDMALSKWDKIVNRPVDVLQRLVAEMLRKEGDLTALEGAGVTRDKKGSIVDKNGEIEKISLDITTILIALNDTKKNLYKEAAFRDVYFKVT